MELKLDAVLLGRALGGVVIFLALISAIVGAVSARAGGFDTFLAFLAPPLAVGILIIVATGWLKAAQERPSPALRRPAGLPADAGDPAPDTPAGDPSAQAGAATRGAALRRPVPLPADAGDPAGDDASPRAAAQPGLGLRQANLRLTVGSIGAPVAGLLVIASVFIPWILVMVTFGGEFESEGVTLLEMGREGDEFLIQILPYLFFALGLVCMPAVVLLRGVGIAIGIAGMVVTLAAFLYIFVRFIVETEGASAMGISVLPVPHLGCLLTGGSFLLMTLLLVSRKFNRPLRGP